MYMAIGLCLGVAFGTALDNLPLGIAIGVAVGAGIDSSRSSKRKKDKEDKEIAKKYSLEKFNILECSNNKKIFVNKSVNVNSNICDMELE